MARLDTYAHDDDGSTCPGPGCDCPDCVSGRAVDAAHGASSMLPVTDTAYRRWLASREATQVLGRMVADNRLLDAQLAAEGLLDAIETTAHVGVGFGEVSQEFGKSLRREEV